jgi:hypothetical protein
LNPLEELAGQLIVVSRSLAFIMLVWSMVSTTSLVGGFTGSN